LKDHTDFLSHIGPGIITGAADDDPSGIATYTQAGAQFGTGLIWSVLLSLPFMIAIQLISARIGRVTGKGIASNLRVHLGRRVVFSIVVLLVVANTINIAADLAAMGGALQLVFGGRQHLYSLLFGLGTVLLQILVPYRKLAPILKWLTLTLFAYVAAVFTVQVPWTKVFHDLVIPQLQWSSSYWTMLVAVLGTTISPYLFFWQASQEVEETRLRGGLGNHQEIQLDLERVKRDTWVGMIFSNGIAFFIMVLAAVTLGAAGITNVESAAQAAAALRPLAGEFAFSLFAAGIVATGLLAVPVLASSSAYAVAEAFEWKDGLGYRWSDAQGFYGVIAIATALGVALDFTPIDPMRALVWSAIINGVVAVPLMLGMLLLVTNPKVLGSFVAGRKTRFFGWSGLALMCFAVMMMIWDFF
jgi:NRAMP (natural resistance-associated macrophage protein)-like metal ion transporter